MNVPEMSYLPGRIEALDQRDMSKAIEDDAIPEEWDGFEDARNWDWQFGDATAAR